MFLCSFRKIAQGAKKSLSVAIIDEFYTFEFETQGQNFALHCIPLITKVTLPRNLIGRNLISFLII